MTERTVGRSRLACSAMAWALRCAASRRGGMAALFVAVLVLSGCSGSSKPAPRPATPAGPVFTGEDYLRGTVGSMARLRDFRPTLVAGWGLVVLPPGAGTGSSDVPSFLRQWLINEMRRKGVGSFEFDAGEMSPRQMLASKDTAVVRVQGLIPAGAARGATFPILVSAVEGTQTTSLEGGTLWTTDLSIGGDNTSMAFTRKLAEGKGAVFINPFDDKTPDDQKLHFRRQGVVIGGGIVSEDQPIELVLNQPNYTRARLIADRINERFTHEAATEVFNTAVAKSDLLIRLNVPKQFAGESQKLMRMIEHLYVARTPGFEQTMGQRLGEVLVRQPQQSRSVVEAWQALGATALAVIREYYEHPADHARMAALEAGAWLQDELAAIRLAAMTLDAEPRVRRSAADLLGRMPRSTRAARALQRLVDDPETPVRIAAYESLLRIGDQTVHRTIVGDAVTFKFHLDVVKARNPLVYISQRDLPTLVVFGPNTGFKDYTNVALWDGRLRLKAGQRGETMRVFYQQAHETEGMVQEIAPFVANLALVMGHRASAQRPVDGFDLSFASVINAIYNLQRQGHLIAELEIEQNPLAAVIAQAEQRRDAEVRPDETDVETLPDAATDLEPPPQPQGLGRILEDEPAPR